MFLTNSVFLESGHSFRSPISDNTNAASRRLHGITIKAYFFTVHVHLSVLLLLPPPQKKRKPQDHERSPSPSMLERLRRFNSHLVGGFNPIVQKYATVKIGSFPNGVKIRHTVDGQNPAPPRNDYPIIYRVLTIPGGAGFRPSTVFQTYLVLQ